MAFCSVQVIADQMVTSSLYLGWGGFLIASFLLVPSVDAHMKPHSSKVRGGCEILIALSLKLNERPHRIKTGIKFSRSSGPNFKLLGVIGL